MIMKILHLTETGCYYFEISHLKIWCIFSAFKLCFKTAIACYLVCAACIEKWSSAENW